LRECPADENISHEHGSYSPDRTRLIASTLTAKFTVFSSINKSQTESTQLDMREAILGIDIGSATIKAGKYISDFARGRANANT
jgi:activator of 2-hydroxyglutaryl-CoA dehydratase